MKLSCAVRCVLFLQMTSIYLGGFPNPVAGLSAEQGVDEVQVIEIKSSFDKTLQKALWWSPKEATRASGQARKHRVPLLVSLHSWSSDFKQGMDGEYSKRCKAYGWAFINPDFRGPNRTPMACGSDAAVADIVDAVRYAKSVANIDERRIYLVGGSGGGYMALVMAHRQPKIWAAISSWVPITDLAAWYQESVDRKLRYAQDLESVCGGPPGSSEGIDSEFRRRSPLFFLAAARGVTIDISSGIHDGHTGSVPVSHALRAFNVLADSNGYPAAKISAEDINLIVERDEIPSHLKASLNDSGFTKHLLLRRQAGAARLSLFDGGHEILYDTAFEWLSKQQKPKNQARP
jgi:pimeloyl-ACP methyl ester carboxylesterase